MMKKTIKIENYSNKMYYILTINTNLLVVKSLTNKFS